MREPLLLPVCGLAAGIVAGRATPFGWLDGPLAALLLAALALCLAHRRHPRLALAAFALAFIPLGGWLATRARPDSPLPLAQRESRELTGCVTAPVSGAAGHRWFVLESSPGQRFRVHVPDDTRLHYGQRVRLRARVRPPSGFRNPGSFNYADWLAARGIHAQASVAKSADLTPLPGACGQPFPAFVFGLRTRALHRLDSLYAHSPFARGMMKGLLLGDSSEIQRVWVDHFRRTGTYHALVISGSHITFVAGLFFLLRRLFRWGESALYAAAIAVAWLYALVAGADPPVLRSAAGLTLAILARFWYRRIRLLNIVAAVALLFLLLDPWQLFEASFQLSFLAVTAIAALGVPAIERTSGHWRTALARLLLPRQPADPADPAARLTFRIRFLAETLALFPPFGPASARRTVAWTLRPLVLAWDLFLISALIQVALVLPMVAYFHRFSLTGLSANVLVTPVITAAIPFGFAAVLTGWTLPAACAAALLRLAESLAAFHARLEPAWRVPDPPVWLAILFCALLILSAVILRHAPRCTPLPALAAAATLAAILLHPFPARLVPGALELTMIDVGQGDSLFISTPGRGALLLDAGGLPAWRTNGKPRFDIGEEVVAPYLWTRGIRRLDALALSHLHGDHAGGAPAILDAFRPAELWVAPQPDSPAWRELQQHARRHRIPIRLLRRGDTFNWKGARIEVLAPLPPLEYQSSRDPNECLVLRLRHGRHSFFLAGDAEPIVERRLLDAGELAKADVLKVSHHGSRRSTRPDFLAALRPAFALISVGRDNPHGMPGSRVLESLQTHSAAVLRTDLEGLVTIRSDGRRLSVQTHSATGAPAWRQDPF